MKNNGRDNRDNKRDIGRDGRMENDRATREAKWKKIFNMAPCACCGASDHAMLSPNRDAAGQAIQCEYICPATQYSTWEEGRHAQPPFMKFTANASKFAKMCDNDVSRAHEALRKYMEHGSGQYKNQQDRSTFKSAVLMACKAPQSVEAYPRHVRVMDAKREERCESCMIEDVNYDGDGNRVNELSIEYDSTDIEVGGDQGIVVAIGNHVNGLSGETGQTIRHSALHLLLATQVTRATAADITAFQYGQDDEAVAKVSEDLINDDQFSRGLMVRLRMPYGKEYVVPYTKVTGRILADTGSTTTLINEDFAIGRGLVVEDGAREVILRDVNNGAKIVKKQCYLRLTLTTVWGDEVTATLLALCVKNLSHDLLLGMRDLERYKVSVIPHRGEAQMQIGDSIEVFPMLDGVQIRHLQELTNIQMEESNDRC